MTWEDIIKEDSGKSIEDIGATIEILRDTIDRMFQKMKENRGMPGYPKYTRLMEVRSELLDIVEDLIKERTDEERKRKGMIEESRRRATERRQNR